MHLVKQYTLKKEYTFEGKGLHSGKFAHMTVCPAPAGTGIRFFRVDLGEDACVDAVAENVSCSARSTTISNGNVSVSTIEHILSALTGLGVDNSIIKIDSSEVPILDGSARLYMEKMAPDGVQEQDADRRWVEIKEEIVLEDKPSGAYLKVVPSDEPDYQVTIDFNSRVLGVQTVKWNAGVDYVREIAPCRTFCFFHEIVRLASLGLVKGGDVENAIVVVEKPVRKLQLWLMAKTFGQPFLSVTPEGYLSNLKLRFPDECGRHKLLDLMGDLRLSGGFIKGRVVAFKPGHRLNTLAAKKIREKNI